MSDEPNAPASMPRCRGVELNYGEPRVQMCIDCWRLAPTRLSGRAPDRITPPMEIRHEGGHVYLHCNERLAKP